MSDVFQAREQLIRSALRCVSGEHANEADPHYAAEIEYADELLALAARDLTRAVEALPADKRPVGWDREET